MDDHQPARQQQQKRSKCDIFFDTVEILSYIVETAILMPLGTIDWILENIQSLIAHNAFTFEIFVCLTILVVIPTVSLSVGLGVGLGVGCSRTNTIYINQTNPINSTGFVNSTNSSDFRSLLF